MLNKELISYFDHEAEKRDAWRARNWYYHAMLQKLIRFIVPEGETILELGSGTGDLLVDLKPSRGVGVDISPKMVEIAAKKYPHVEWKVGDAAEILLGEKFEYIIISDLIGYLDDVEHLFTSLERVCHEHTRVVITYYNYLWEPLLRLGEFLHIKSRQPLQNWLSARDIENMLALGGFEVVKRGKKMIFPLHIPLLSTFLNGFVGNLPLISSLGLIQYVVARQIPRVKKEYSVSVIVPARNERGNIRGAVERMPQFGAYQEIIFIEGGSTDGTYEEIERICKEYAGRKNIRFAKQDGNGKGDAVRKGFSMAKGDVLMILDADLTVRPEDLPKFYNALASGKGEFINGSRLVYQLEDESMRFLNMIGNKFFSLVFSWLLGQRIKDTLCGTKVLLKKDYEKISAGRSYFGDFDPFGDFDLLFGAAKLNLKIVEIPVRYQARTYGTTNIQRWKHGWLLLKMTAFAMRKIKFI